jgi:acyl carrier protein
MDMGNSAEALKTADKASVFAKKSKDPLFEAETMLATAETYYGVAIRNDTGTRQGASMFHKCANKAFQTAKLAKARCDRFQFTELLPKALCVEGETGIKFDSTGSLKCAEQAEKLFKENEDDVGVATAVVLQANVLYHQGKHAEAKTKAEKGLDLAERAGAADLAAEAADILEANIEMMPKGAAVAVVAAVEDVADAGPTPDVGAASIAAPAKTGLDPEVVLEQVKKVAEMSLAEGDVEADTALMDAGLDSLASVAFRNSLQSELKMNMPASLMFDYPNIRQITDFIVEKSQG